MESRLPVETMEGNNPEYDWSRESKYEFAVIVVNYISLSFLNWAGRGFNKKKKVWESLGERNLYLYKASIFFLLLFIFPE